MTTTALTVSPIVTLKDGQAFANSRDVASFFGKRHDNVLRDIDVMLAGPSDLRGLFQEHAEYHDKAHKLVRGFDMTKDGFTLLAMGFTGAKALQFKLVYIAAFKELDVKNGSTNHLKKLDANARQPVPTNLVQGFGGGCETATLISEPGLYKMIMRSG
jgi:Rha family phage regulatory protein